MKYVSILLLGLSMTVVILFVGKSFLQNVPENARMIENNFSLKAIANMNVEPDYQNLTVAGDIVVEKGTYLIENMELHLIGKITARNDATVMVKNAKLVLTTRDETYYREGIVLTSSSKLIVENATMILKSTDIHEPSYITVGDEALVNITDSELLGIAHIIGGQNSRMYVNHSILKGPDPLNWEAFGVITHDNATARIQNSELDSVQAGDYSSISVSNSTLQGRGVTGSVNGVIEVENSNVRIFQWLFDNVTLRIVNSTADTISFAGSVMRVQDSRIKWEVMVYGNSTTWLKNTSVDRVQAYAKSQVWLINSPTKEINTFDEGRVFVGLELPVFGTVAVPHLWMPILYAALFLSIMIIIVASAVFINKRWKRYQSKKVRHIAESEAPKSG